MHRNVVKFRTSGTEITGIRHGSFRYISECGDEGRFFFNTLKSDCIEFDYYTSNGITVNIGDELSYYIETDYDPYFVERVTSRQVFVRAQFIVTSAKVNAGICHVIAYDVTTKLDIDFSGQLKQMESSFPMTVKDLADAVAAYAGLTINNTGNWGLYIPEIPINYFYIEGITCRQILLYLSQLFPLARFSASTLADTLDFARVASLTVYSGYWNDMGRYLITPDDTARQIPGSQNYYSNVYYKQNSLIEEEEFSMYDGVELRDIKTGNVIASYYPTGSEKTNVYTIKNAILSEYCVSGQDFDDEFRSEYTNSLVNLKLRQVTVKTFPFRNVYYTPTQGFKVYETDDTVSQYCSNYIEINDSEVIIKSYAPDLTANENGIFYGTEYSQSLSGRINELEARLEGIADLIYPVGSIYMSLDPTSPGVLFGGTWDRIEGKFLLAATDGGSSGASQAAGNTGGEATHLLTSAESGVPAHSHGITSNYSRTFQAGTNKDGYLRTGTSGTTNIEPGVANNTAANAAQAHNNMPPYLSVYVWKRTA